MTEIRDRFARIGNDLAADFVNTVVSFERDGGSLHSADDVVDFLRVTGALDERDDADARVLARSDPAFLDRGRSLREAVRAALLSIEHGHRPEDDTLAAINTTLRADASYDRMVSDGDAIRVTRERLGADALALLAPIARDAARLLTTPGVPIRKCAADDCVRHFYDDSRTKRRRWCDMAICGNRAKVAAFSARRAERQ